jgi:hypothetical protein
MFGRGGSSVYFTLDGLPGTGYGAGGSGGANENTSLAYKGGDGTDGLILIYEYS